MERYRLTDVLTRYSLTDTFGFTIFSSGYGHKMEQNMVSVGLAIPVILAAAGLAFISVRIVNGYAFYLKFIGARGPCLINCRGGYHPIFLITKILIINTPILNNRANLQQLIEKGI
jgi:hypothetical protein